MKDAMVCTYTWTMMNHWLVSTKTLNRDLRRSIRRGEVQLEQKIQVLCKKRDAQIAKTKRYIREEKPTRVISLACRNIRNYDAKIEKCEDRIFKLTQLADRVDEAQTNEEYQRINEKIATIMGRSVRSTDEIIRGAREMEENRQRAELAMDMYQDMDSDVEESDVADLYQYMLDTHAIEIPTVDGHTMQMVKNLPIILNDKSSH